MKKVTMQAIADRAGISVSGVCYGIKRGNPRIVSIAREMGYKTRVQKKAEREAELEKQSAEYRAELERKAEVRKHKVITCRTIAKDLGCHYHTVEKVLNGRTDVRESLAAVIREYAKKVGYVPVTKAMAKRARFLEEIGFGTAEQLEEHMRMLRNRGYTNAEIAHKCGADYVTVLRYIGKQPKEYTAETMKVMGKQVRVKNAAREARIENFKKAKQERINAEIEQTRTAKVIYLQQAAKCDEHITELYEMMGAL